MASKGQLRVRIVGDDKHLRKKLKGAGKAMGKFAGVAGAAVAGIAAFSVKEFANFDDAMTKSLAIMGDVSDTMRKDMSDAAREVGKTTKFSAEEAAESYFFLASAGMDAAQSIEALPRVAAFAQAGNFDMAQATDLATDAQSALGLTAEDTAENIANLNRVQDVFVKANTLANASVEQFATSMTRKAGAALQAVNKDIEEGTAMLAVFADQGIKGEQAGTMLRTTLSGLSRNARDNADAFADLNVEVFDADGEMRNMADIVGDLETGLAGMSTEQREATIAQMGFTEEQRDGILALLGNSEALRGYESDLRDAAGTTQEVADKQMESFSAKMGLIWDQIKDVGLSIGEALMPALQQFADWLQANLPSITAWFDDVATKFNELLGASHESTDGLEADLGALDIRSKEIARKYEGTLGEMASENLAQMSAMGLDVQAFQEKSGSELGTAEGFMERLGDAWQTVWEEDIEPWMMNTLIPWIENTFVPALADALWRGGKAAAGAMHRGFMDNMPWWARGITGGIGLPGHDAFGDAQKLVDRFSPFHSGGVIPGRKGEEVPIMAMAGETVLPTHDSNAMRRLVDDADRQASAQLHAVAGTRPDDTLRKILAAVEADKHVSVQIDGREIVRARSVRDEQARVERRHARNTGR